MRTDAECVAVLNAGATANLVRFRRAGHLNEILKRNEIPRTTAYPARARFTFGDGRRGEVRRDGDI